MTCRGCPCCAAAPSRAGDGDGHFECAHCAHLWTPRDLTTDDRYYRDLIERNDLAAPWFQRKLASRADVLCALIAAIGARSILEIGCAEGSLGRLMRQRTKVTYNGIELSRDAGEAAKHLNHVFTVPASQLDTARHDLIVSFHVLEHIEDVAGEIRAWTKLLAPKGRLVIEVPHRSGHPLVDYDRNREHLHQFSIASLACLLSRCGLDIEQLSRGHAESPVYPDSLRLVARLAQSPAERALQLVARFKQRLDGPFLVYGIGGDFENYMLPVIDALPVAGLLDSSPAKQGMIVAGHVIAAYDPQRHARLPVLVSSIRFGGVIRKQLGTIGVAAERIVGLDEIYDPS